MEKQLINKIEDIAFRDYLYNYRGDQIMNCVYNATAPIHDLFIISSR